MDRYEAIYIAQCAAVKVLKIIFLIRIIMSSLILAAVEEDSCFQCLRELYHCGDEIRCVYPFSAGVVPHQGGHGEKSEKKAVYHVLQ